MISKPFIALGLKEGKQSTNIQTTYILILLRFHLESEYTLSTLRAELGFPFSLDPGWSPLGF